MTVPIDASSGSYTLTGTGTYRWSDGTQSGTAQGEGGFLVLVPPTGSPYVSDLSWLSATNGYGPVLINKNYYGGPLIIHGTTYAYGLWLNANASLHYYLGANCSRFTADVGIDASDHGIGSVVYRFFADGILVYDSGVVTNSTPTLHVNADVTGAHILQLDVGDAGDGINFDNADIAAPQLICGS